MIDRQPSKMILKMCYANCISSKKKWCLKGQWHEIWFG